MDGRMDVSELVVGFAWKRFILDDSRRKSRRRSCLEQDSNVIFWTIASMPSVHSREESGCKNYLPSSKSAPNQEALGSDLLPLRISPLDNENRRRREREKEAPCSDGCVRRNLVFRPFSQSSIYLVLVRILPWVFLLRVLKKSTVGTTRDFEELLIDDVWAEREFLVQRYLVIWFARRWSLFGSGWHGEYWNQRAVGFILNVKEHRAKCTPWSVCLSFFLLSSSSFFYERQAVSMLHEILKGQARTIDRRERGGPTMRAEHWPVLYFSSLKPPKLLRWAAAAALLVVPITAARAIVY